MPNDFAYTDRDLDISAKTLWGECRGEPLLGQQAVAWVIRNRAAWLPSAWWGDTPASVCLKSWQFSCWNRNSPEFAAMQALDVAVIGGLREIARAVFAGETPDPTGGATMYQRVGTGALWSKGLPIAKLIGHHEFYVLGPHGE